MLRDSEEQQALVEFCAMRSDPVVQNGDVARILLSCEFHFHRYSLRLWMDLGRGEVEKSQSTEVLTKVFNVINPGCLLYAIRHKVKFQGCRLLFERTQQPSFKSKWCAPKVV